MRNRPVVYALLTLLGASLAGCAAQPRRELASLPGRDACFWTRTLFDWTVLDDSTLLVHAPTPNDAYLVKLFAPIPDLKFHDALGFQGGNGPPGQFCAQNGAVIAGGPVPEREPVIAVRALTAAQARQLLAGAGSTKSHRMGGSS